MVVNSYDNKVEWKRLNPEQSTINFEGSLTLINGIRINIFYQT